MIHNRIRNNLIQTYLQYVFSLQSINYTKQKSVLCTITNISISVCLQVKLTVYVLDDGIPSRIPKKDGEDSGACGEYR